MAEAGIDLRTMGRILNHKERGIIRLYNRYQFDKRSNRAWTLWARKLSRILFNRRACDSKAQLRPPFRWGENRYAQGVLGVRGLQPLHQQRRWFVLNHA